MIITKKKVCKDFILNLISSLVITIVLQLLVYPILSQEITPEKFGSLLTLIGMTNALAATFGNSLNNIRLLRQEQSYINKYCDYWVILKKVIFITAMCMILTILIFNGQVNFIESIILIIATVLTMLRGYMNVYYRVQLDYIKISSHFIIAALGYIVGLGIFKIIPFWPIVFCTGELFAFIYAYNNTEFKREKYVKSSFYVEIKKDYIQLSMSNLVANMLLYLDRLLINPILGPANVVIFFVSSIVGKTVGIALNPLASIVLSYISKMKANTTKILFTRLSLISIVMGTVIYIITIPMSPIIVSILYPESLLEAKQYFNIANLSSIVMICGSLINPIVLKNVPMWWQNIIQLIYAGVYVGGSLILLKSFGLIGFCYVGLSANIIRLILIESIGYYYIFIKDNNDKI